MTINYNNFPCLILKTFEMSKYYEANKVHECVYKVMIKNEVTFALLRKDKTIFKWASLSGAKLWIETFCIVEDQNDLNF